MTGSIFSMASVNARGDARAGLTDLRGGSQSKSLALLRRYFRDVKTPRMTRVVRQWCEFYENVSKAKMKGRKLDEGEKDENVVLEFKPNPPHDMLVACLWSRWSAPGEPDLLSFAAITDEPPPEISAAGHDRRIIPIKPENVDAWLNPDASDLAALYAILDDRDRPYYEHRLAA